MFTEILRNFEANFPETDLKKLIYEKEKINYDSSLNLYHNMYDKLEIESFCINNKKVHSIKWFEINDKECSLHVKIKQQ